MVSIDIPEEDPRAKALAIKYNLYSERFTIETLNEMMEDFCKHWALDALQIRIGKMASTVLGRFRSREEYPGAGYKAVDILVSYPYGLTVGTLIHELSHYLDFIQRGRTGHGKQWKDLHVQTLANWIDNNDISEWIMIDNLNWFWVNRPALYKGIIHDGITNDELFFKLIAVEEAVRGRPWTRS